jgi:hypothetical protein
VPAGSNDSRPAPVLSEELRKLEHSMQNLVAASFALEVYLYSFGVYLF